MENKTILQVVWHWSRRYTLSLYKKVVVQGGKSDGLDLIQLYV